MYRPDTRIARKLLMLDSKACKEGMYDGTPIVKASPCTEIPKRPSHALVLSSSFTTTNTEYRRGESAGAGSIAHHLTAFGGTVDPLFKRAVIQSSAFVPQIDGNGALERQCQTFASLSSCAELVCLRQADTATLQSASTAYYKTLLGGNPGWDPAVVGDLAR